MRGGHGLRLGRAALAQVDAQHQQYGDGQELALPVLEALVPELRIPKRLDHGLRGLMMLKSLLVDPARAARQMQPEGGEKECHECDAEGVRVELQQQAAPVE